MYPAGFLYLYTALRWLTGGAILPAQLLFAVLYLANQALVLALYIQAQVRRRGPTHCRRSAHAPFSAGFVVRNRPAYCQYPGSTSSAA